MKRSQLSSTILISALALMLCLLAGLAASAQDKERILNKDAVKEVVKLRNNEFCSENWSSDKKQSYRELREMNVAAGGVLDVDAGKNGGISVRGEDRSDILVRACVQSWADTADAARAAVSSVRVTTAGGVRADGPEGTNYSVSFQILVPRSTDLSLRAHNGGISISSVRGRLEFETTNGGVNLVDLSGEVKGRTTNGGVNVLLAGRSWDGGGLDVQTSNGGVRLAMPQGYAANLETGTVNGGFSSDIPELNITTEDVKGTNWNNRARQIKTAINGGGAPVRVTTTNGGIRITTADSSQRY